MITHDLVDLIRLNLEPSGLSGKTKSTESFRWSKDFQQCIDDTCNQALYTETLKCNLLIAIHKILLTRHLDKLRDDVAFWRYLNKFKYGS